MTLDEFRAAEEPPADPALQALWWIHRGDWARAHQCAQSGEGDPRCDWVHAHLHRVEGDLGNAAYWYRRAGHDPATAPLEQEWEKIATSLLA